MPRSLIERIVAALPEWAQRRVVGQAMFGMLMAIPVGVVMTVAFQKHGWEALVIPFAVVFSVLWLLVAAELMVKGR